MDDRKFDALVRAVMVPGSRRAALAAAVAGVAGFAGVAGAEAGRRDRTHRRRTRRRIRRLRRRARRRNEPVPPGDATCAGADGCFYPRCVNNGIECYCHIHAGTGVPFCGGPVHDVLNCGECGANETCIVIASDCGGGFGCAAECG